MSCAEGAPEVHKVLEAVKLCSAGLVFSSCLLFPLLFSELCSNVPVIFDHLELSGSRLALGN